MIGFFRRLSPDETVTRVDVQYGLGWLVRYGVCIQAMETLTIGAFLVAYALHLGASNLQIGILAAIPHLAQFSQFLGIYLVERIRKRRLIAVVAGMTARPMLLIMAAAAFLPDPQVALLVVIGGFLLRYLFGAIMGVGWNAWIPDIVPAGKRGRFFARRQVLMTLVGMALSLLAAAVVDFWGIYWPDTKVLAYSVLLTTAFLFGAGSVYCLSRVPEERMPEPAAHFSLRELLARPFRDVNFRALLLFLGSWNFAVNLAAPFFTVYMLTRLGLDLTVVTAFAVVSQFANVLVLRQWGAIIDRFSSKSVLSVCAPLFILCIFAWTFTTFPEKHFLTLPMLAAIHVLMGIATAGVTVGSTSIALKLAPKGEGAAYLSANSLLNSAAAGLAPMIGGAFADFFAKRELSLNLEWKTPDSDILLPALSLRHWDFFFIFATVIGIYAIHRLSLVREVGEVAERVVIGEFLMGTRRALRNVSSVAGLRALTEFPFESIRRARRRTRLRAERARRASQAVEDPDGADRGPDHPPIP